MKHFFLILIFCGFYSCGDDPTQTHTLKNETDFSLEIQSFSHRGTVNNTFIVSAEIINLEPLGQISFKRSSGEDFDNRNWFSEDSIDSVRIVFNDEKLLILECELSNPYSCHSIFQSNDTASITNNDYEEAILIE
jgi:hypothetical protein